jgi:hypothetical protein
MATGAASAVRAASPSPSSLPSKSVPTRWQAYSDQKFAFAISYPTDFVVQDGTVGSLPPPWLFELRVADKRYATGGAPGQIEIGIYTRDADTPGAWVQKHTGPCSGPNTNAFFWDKTGNLQTLTAAGRDAVSFDLDMRSCGGFALTVHETVLLLGSKYVLRFDWWSKDSAYSRILEPIAQQMLSTLRD